MTESNLDTTIANVLRMVEDLCHFTIFYFHVVF